MNALKCTFGMVLMLTIFNDILGQGKADMTELKSALEQDSLFWQAYNECNVDGMRNFFTDDVEFYHDKSGMMKGVDKLLAVSKQNLCSNPDYRLRREPVAGSVKIFPMKNGETLYGAILSGQHVFYIIEKGKQPRLDGLAHYSHLMLKTESGWKMSRVLSYDHGPAPYVNRRTEVVVSENTLKSYEGKYKATNSGHCEIKQQDGSLLLSIGRDTFVLYPEKENLFFVKDRDLTFEFKENKIIVRENGQIVEQAPRVK